MITNIYTGAGPIFPYRAGVVEPATVISQKRPECSVYTAILIGPSQVVTFSRKRHGMSKAKDITSFFKRKSDDAPAPPAKAVCIAPEGGSDEGALTEEQIRRAEANKEAVCPADLSSLDRSSAYSPGPVEACAGDGCSGAHRHGPILDHRTARRV